MLLEQGNAAAAVDDVDRAFALNPDHNYSLLLRAKCLSLLGKSRMRESVDACTRFLTCPHQLTDAQAQNHDDSILMLRGLGLVEIGHVEEALDDLDRVSEHLAGLRLGNFVETLDLILDALSYIVAACRRPHKPKGHKQILRKAQSLYHLFLPSVMQ